MFYQPLQDLLPQVNESGDGAAAHPIGDTKADVQAPGGPTEDSGSAG